MAHRVDQAHQAAGHADLVVVPLHAVAFLRRTEGVVPTHDGQLRVPGVGHHRHQRAAVHPLPAPLQRDEAGRFAAGRQQREPLLHVQPHADGDAQAPLGQEAAAAPPAQRRIVAHVGPMKDPQLAPLELDDAVFLRLRARAVRIGQPGPVGGQVILAHRAGHLYGPGVKAQVAAHDAGAVVAVAGKVVEGRVHPAKQPRRDQFQLDLFQRPAVELLGDLDP